MVYLIIMSKTSAPSSAPYTVTIFTFLQELTFSGTSLKWLCPKRIPPTSSYRFWVDHHPRNFMVTISSPSWMSPAHISSRPRRNRRHGGSLRTVSPCTLSLWWSSWVRLFQVSSLGSLRSCTTKASVILALYPNSIRFFNKNILLWTKAIFVSWMICFTMPISYRQFSICQPTAITFSWQFQPKGISFSQPFCERGTYRST